MFDKLKWLQDAIGELKGAPVTISNSTELKDLGLDSLDIVELQMMYEDKVGYQTPDDISEEIITVEDLLKLMQ